LNIAGENAAMKWAWLVTACVPVFLHAQTAETRDYGVAPSAELRLSDYHAPTPLEIPGARAITTPELREALQAPLEARPLLFDVVGDDGHMTLPGSIWLPGAGHGSSFDDEIQAQLAKLLDFATRGNRARALVFFCVGPDCWLSYNAALRAARLGYSAVRWYRGGIEAWRADGGALTQPRIVWKRPSW
jgi:PQQ-dependent catabolism-associated CXXCW motif protein